jgi:hypothetical protein
MKSIRNWDVFGYFAAVLLAVGLLFAITAVPSNSAELFPNPSPKELLQGLQWAWDGPSKSRQ